MILKGAGQWPTIKTQDLQRGWPEANITQGLQRGWPMANNKKPMKLEH
jgi:hypothetical protein